MLTDIACRKATCPPGKARERLTDAGGLYLEVSPAGSKRWFWKYRHDGKEGRLALGSYPAVSLATARKNRDASREALKAGINPVQKRKAERLEQELNKAATFETVAREFCASMLAGWSDGHGRRWLERMEQDLFPKVGSLPLADVSAPMLLDALRRVEKRGANETTHRLRQQAGQVFRYGIATGRAKGNPAADLRGALRPVNVRHMAALLEPQSVGELLRGIDDYTGQFATRTALMLSAYLFQRPGNIRAMEWAEIDANTAMWTIPAAKMKRRIDGKLNGRPHFVPLAPQVLALLEEMRPLTGAGRYVFPALTSTLRPMSENTVRQALRRLGYANEDMTAHGFRAMARTLIAEKLPGIHADVVEAQLAHGKRGPLGMAYDRAEYMAQRCTLMATWANYLDTLKAGDRVIQFRSSAA